MSSPLQWTDSLRAASQEFREEHGIPAPPTLETTAMATRDQDPSQLAAGLQLSEQSGMSPTMALINRAHLEERAMVERIKSHPSGSFQRAFEDPNTFTMAKGVVPELERVFAWDKYPGYLASQFAAGGGEVAMGGLGLAELTSVTSGAGRLTGWREDAYKRTMQFVEDRPRELDLFGGGSETAAAVLPEFFRGLPQIGLSIAGGAAGSVVPVVGTALGYIGPSVGMEAGMMWTSLQRGQAPLSSDQDAAAISWGYGLVAGSFEALGAGIQGRALMSGFRRFFAREVMADTTKRALFKQLFEVATSTMAEGSTETVQAIAERVFELQGRVNDGQMTQDQMFEALTSLETLRDILYEGAAGAIVGGGLGTTSMSLSIGGQARAAKQGELDREALLLLNEGATAAQMKTAAPGVFKNFLFSISDDAEVNEVIIDAGTISKFASDSANADLLNDLNSKIEGFGDQVSAALKDSTPVTISVTDWASHFVGTNITEALMPGVKFSHEALSENEAKNLATELKDPRLQELAEELKTGATKDQWREAFERNRDYLADRLVHEMGMKEEDSKDQATTLASTLTTLALATSNDPLAFFDSWMERLHLQRGKAEDFAAVEGVAKPTDVLGASSTAEPVAAAEVAVPVGGVLLSRTKSEKDYATRFGALIEEEKRAKSAYDKVSAEREVLSGDLVSATDRLINIDAELRRLKSSLPGDEYSTSSKVARLVVDAQGLEAKQVAVVDELRRFDRQVRGPAQKAYREATYKKSVHRETYFSNTGRTVHGAHWFENRDAYIALFEDTNFATFSHESAHLVLNIAADLSRDENAAQWFKDDMTKLLQHLGAESFETLTRAQLEEFAESWTRYLQTGEAPNEAVAGAFAYFKRVLALVHKIYRKGINDSNEVHAIFGRLMVGIQAADDATAAKSIDSPLFTEAVAAEAFGWAPNDYRRYLNDLKKDTAKANLRAFQEVLRSIRSENRAKIEAAKDKLREKVHEELKDNPAYQVLQRLRRTEPFAEDVKFPELSGYINRKALSKYLKGSSAGKRLFVQVEKYTTAKGGMTSESLEKLALLHGFPDVLTMLHNIVHPSLTEEAIAQDVEKRFKELHSDLVVPDSQLVEIASREVLAAGASEAQMREIDLLREAGTKKAADPVKALEKRLKRTAEWLAKNIATGEKLLKQAEEKRKEQLDREKEKGAERLDRAEEKRKEQLDREKQKGAERLDAAEEKRKEQLARAEERADLIRARLEVWRTFAKDPSTIPTTEAAKLALAAIRNNPGHPNRTRALTEAGETVRVARAHSAEQIKTQAAARKSQATGRVTLRFIKAQAQLTVSKMTVEELSGLKKRYLAGVARAAREAVIAVSKKDWNTAADERLKQVFAVEVVAEIARREKKLSKLQGRVTKFAKGGSIKNLLKTVPQYILHFQAMMNRYGMSKPPVEAPMDSLQTFVTHYVQTRMTQWPGPGVEFNAADTRSFKELSLYEAESILSAALALREWALAEAGYISGVKAVRFQAKANALVDAANRFGSGGLEAKSNWRKRTAKMGAALIRWLRFFDELDEERVDGPFKEHIYRVVSDAEKVHHHLILSANHEVNKLFRKYFPKILDRKAFTNRTIDISDIVGKSTNGNPTVISESQLIGMAMLFGNSGGRAAMAEVLPVFRPLKPGEVQQILDKHLSDTNMDMMKELYALLESFWPAVEALERRVNGVSPARVEPAPYTVRGRIVEGGYMPLHYTAESANDRVQLTHTTAHAGQFFTTHFGSPMTQKGYTYKRTGSAGQQPEFDITSVIPSHLDEVARDLAYREPIAEVWKLLTDSQVSLALKESVGPEVYAEMKSWVQLQVAPFVATNGWERLMRTARQWGMIKILGANAATILVQIPDVLRSIPEVGVSRSLKAYVNMFRYKHGGWKSVVGTMQNLRDISPHLHDRFRNLDLTRMELHSEIQFEGTKLTRQAREELAKFVFGFIGFADGLAATGVWMAGYDAAMAGEREGAAKGDHESAVRYADELVIMTMGHATRADLPTVMSDPSVIQFALSFFGIQSTNYNLYAKQIRRFKRIARGDGRPKEMWRSALFLAVHMFALVYIEQMIRASLKSVEDDDDDEEFLAKYAQNIVAAGVNSVPFGAQAMHFMARGPFGGDLSMGSPMVRAVLTPTATLGRDVLNAAFTDDELGDIPVMEWTHGMLPFLPTQNAVKNLQLVFGEEFLEE